jgi:hypothetical protein
LDLRVEGLWSPGILILQAGVGFFAISSGSVGITVIT